MLLLRKIWGVVNRFVANFLFVLGVCCCSLSVARGSDEVRERIAHKIWQNECAGSVKGLVSWNKGENFPSLGIGHFIWFPKGGRTPFEESFPQLIQFCISRGYRVPQWAVGAAPWRSREDFLRADVRGGLPDQMRSWLANRATRKIQTDFIICRSLAALERIKKYASSPRQIEEKYRAVASTANGMYALIDYVNFKGEGVQVSERYQGQGWGLLQVLEEMPVVRTGSQAAVAFSEAAKRVLERRVRLSPPGRGESRWLEGWKNRCDSYKKAL